MDGRPSSRNRFSHEQVIAAAHLVAAESGVANITFRAISKASGIGLGTLSYHYRDRSELILEATKFSKERFFRRFKTALKRAEAPGDVSSALAKVVDYITCSCHEELVVDYDFYLTGLDDPNLRAFCEGWSEETVAMLNDYLPPVSAAAVSYLMEGIFLQSAKLGRRFAVDDLEPVLRHAVGSAARDPATASLVAIR